MLEVVVNLLLELGVDVDLVSTAIGLVKDSNAARDRILTCLVGECALFRD